jgi:hypothetical protein
MQKAAIYNMIPCKVNFTIYPTMKGQDGGRGVSVHFLYPRREMGVGGQRHTPAAASPGLTHYIGSWVGLGNTPIRGSKPGPSSPSESLYWLSYPGRLHIITANRHVIPYCGSELFSEVQQPIRRILKCPGKWRRTDWHLVIIVSKDLAGPICRVIKEVNLGYYGTSRKVAVSIPEGVIRIFHWHNFSGPTVALRSTQRLRNEHQEYFRRVG